MKTCCVVLLCMMSISVGAESVNTCYVCGRTESDMELVVESVRDRFEEVLTHEQEGLDRARRAFEEEYGHITPLLETIDPKYRDMQLKTISGDLEAFKKLIPNVDEILVEVKKL